MTPKRSGKPAARKAASPGKKAPKAESPMRTQERSLGPNITGHDDMAQAAHRVPASTEAAGSGSIDVARENTNPSPPGPSTSDEGQRS